MAQIPIPIPKDAKLKIKEGDSVTFDTPLLENTQSELVKISIASSLGFDPEKIFAHLRRFVGDEVKKDSLLAERKSFLSTKQYLSEYEGILKEINHYDGSITMEISGEETEQVSCNFQGKISEITETEIVLSVKHATELQLRDESEAFAGPIVYLDELATNAITDEQIDGHVVCATQIPIFEIAKLEALGARGFLTLHPIEEEMSLPTATAKQIKPFEEAVQKRYTACIIGPTRTTIFLYD